MSEEIEIRFFIDRSLGKTHVVNALRNIGELVEIHDYHFNQATADTDWLPIVALRGWVILTADKKIAHRRLELMAVQESGAIALTHGIIKDVYDSELRQQITSIASSFQIFECVQCAGAIKRFLIEQETCGKQITLFTGSTEDPFCNIYHEIFNQNISTNGHHEAIVLEIEGKELVFDNIHPQGVSRVDWINNLYCPIKDIGGDFQITEIDF